MNGADTVLARQLEEAILEALATGSTQQWKRFLRPSVVDGFAILLSPKLHKRVFRTELQPSFNEWVLRIKSWQRSVQQAVEAGPPIEASLLHDLWESFSEKLRRSLIRGLSVGRRPRSGGVLAFVAGLSKCLIIKYNFSGSMPKLSTVAVIDEPRSAFEFWDSVEQADAVTRNHLKNILASGHKILWHRDVLVHVDRRKEQKVFGPSIDTILMAEILAQDVHEPIITGSSDLPIVPKSVLEVGSGNGFLASSLVRHLPSLEEVFCFDIEFEAIACTHRNLEAIRAIPGSAHNAEIRLITGSYEPNLLKKKFDLIVCNPPYIPPHKSCSETTRPDYLTAVSGVELLKEMIRETRSILSPGGRVLIMTNNQSVNIALQEVPDSCTAWKPLGDSGYEVLFDVEAVFERKQWLNELLERGDIIKRENMYFHVLHPIWISHQQ